MFQKPLEDIFTSIPIHTVLSVRIESREKIVCNVLIKMLEIEQEICIFFPFFSCSVFFSYLEKKEEKKCGTSFLALNAPTDRTHSMTSNICDFLENSLSFDL